MSRAGKQILLAVLLGVLLGSLGWLLLLRRSGPASPAHAPSPVPTSAPVILSTPQPTPAPPTPGPVVSHSEAISALFQSLLQAQPGRWSLYYAPLPEGEPVSLSSDEAPMVSASLIKLFVMGAVFEQLEAGTLDRETADPLLRDCITISDNASANALIRLLGGGDAEAGMEAVNRWCARQGYDGTRLLRLMLQDNGLQNYCTAADCAALLAAIYRGECVSPAASQEMLGLLLMQKVNDRLPRDLPPGTPVAHKTGDLIGLCWADVGVVFSPGGDYILCVISDGTASETEAKTAAAVLSRQIYDLLNPA